MFNGMLAVQDNELAENAIMERPGFHLMDIAAGLGSHSWPSEPVRIWAFPQVEALDSFSPDLLQKECSL